MIEDKRLSKLFALLVDSKSLGTANEWPSLEKYPHYDEIRAIDIELHNEGGKKKMQEKYYKIREYSFDYSETLNGMWHMCKDWLK
jgi:hypothetical protein